MNRLCFVALAALTLTAAAGCKKKPECANLPVPAEGKDLVLDGGKVCKNSSHTMSVSYDGISGDDGLRKAYEAALPGRGWVLTPTKDNKMVLAKKQGQTAMIIPFKSEFGGSTAVISY